MKQRAKDFAARSHGAIDQRRRYTGEPYIVHPAAVVELVSRGRISMRLVNSANLALARSAAASSLGASKSPAKTVAARANAKRPRPGAQGKPKPRKDPTAAENTPAPRLARTVKLSADGRKEMVFQIIELLEDALNPGQDKRKGGTASLPALSAGTRLYHEVWTDRDENGSVEGVMTYLWCRNGFEVQGEFRKAVLSCKQNIALFDSISTSDALLLVGHGLGREPVLSALVAAGKVSHGDILEVSRTSFLEFLTD